MAGENLADPYEAVLADLNAKREQIEQTISLLTALREGRTPVAQAVAQPAGEADAAPNDGAGAFLGMSIVDATKKLLATRKRALGNAEILTDLRAGGLVLTSNDPLNVVSSVLMRRFKTDGDIVRVDRGVWGLKEWYPGRTFKPLPKLVLPSKSADPAPHEVQINDLGGTADDDL